MICLYIPNIYKKNLSHGKFSPAIFSGLQVSKSAVPSHHGSRTVKFLVDLLDKSSKISNPPESEIPQGSTQPAHPTEISGSTVHRFKNCLWVAGKWQPNRNNVLGGSQSFCTFLRKNFSRKAALNRFIAFSNCKPSANKSLRFCLSSSCLRDWSPAFHQTFHGFTKPWRILVDQRPRSYGTAMVNLWLTCFNCQ